MRKFLSFAAVLALLSGCAQSDGVNDRLPITVDTPETLYAEFDNERGENEDETRTYVEDEWMLRWHEGDEISFFPVTYNMCYRFNGQTGDNGGTFSKLTTDIVTGNELPTRYAVYPYREDTKISDEGHITYYFPEEQQWAEKSFGRGANVMVAATENHDDNVLRFKNVGGYLKLQIYSPEQRWLDYLVLEGNNGERIAGEARIEAYYDGEPWVEMTENASTRITYDCVDTQHWVDLAISTDAENPTDLWIVLPPTYFDNGITVRIYDTEGNVCTKSTNNWIPIDRNYVQPLSTFEFVADGDNGGEEDAQIKIYGDVSATGWMNCNAWIWDDGGANYTGGSWPGLALEAEEVDGKMYYAFEVAPEMVGSTVNVIFNNGSEQTVDINGVELNDDVFITLTEVDASGKWLATVAYGAGEVPGGGGVDNPEDFSVSFDIEYGDNNLAVVTAMPNFISNYYFNIIGKDILEYYGVYGNDDETMQLLAMCMDFINSSNWTREKVLTPGHEYVAVAFNVDAYNGVFQEVFSIPEVEPVDPSTLFTYDNLETTTTGFSMDVTSMSDNNNVWGYYVWEKRRFDETIANDPKGAIVSLSYAQLGNLMSDYGYSYDEFFTFMEDVMGGYHSRNISWFEPLENNTEYVVVMFYMNPDVFYPIYVHDYNYVAVPFKTNAPESDSTPMLDIAISNFSYNGESYSLSFNIKTDYSAMDLLIGAQLWESFDFEKYWDPNDWSQIEGFFFRKSIEAYKLAAAKSDEGATISYNNLNRQELVFFFEAKNYDNASTYYAIHITDDMFPTEPTPVNPEDCEWADVYLSLPTEEDAANGWYPYQHFFIHIAGTDIVSGRYFILNDTEVTIEKALEYSYAFDASWLETINSGSVLGLVAEAGPSSVCRLVAELTNANGDIVRFDRVITTTEAVPHPDMEKWVGTWSLSADQVVNWIYVDGAYNGPTLIDQSATYDITIEPRIDIAYNAVEVYGLTSLTTSNGEPISVLATINNDGYLVLEAGTVPIEQINESEFTYWFPYVQTSNGVEVIPHYIAALYLTLSEDGLTATTASRGSIEYNGEVCDVIGMDVFAYDGYTVRTLYNPETMPEVITPAGNITMTRTSSAATASYAPAKRAATRNMVQIELVK
ncbi:MAG: starch-binding protein [Alistipes sp.]|nr:starch-binding protein [Alistipes sp.]